MKKILLLIIGVMQSMLCLHTQAQSKRTMDIIMERIHTDHAVRKAKQADSPSIKLFENWQEDGSWSDIDYAANDMTNWPPSTHLTRLRTIINAYTDKEGSFYGNPQIFSKIQQAFSYWYDHDPKSKNWWHNEIAVPQQLGELLISLRYGKGQLSKEFESKLLQRMKRGVAEEKTGANKTDIALHYLYRALLTQDGTLLRLAVDQLFEPVGLVDGAEGLQYDYSYLQHGPQLYISGYGAVYITGVVSVAKYVAGTEFAMNKEKLKLFSKFYREVYLRTLRSRYIDFNVEGRGLSRKDILKKQSEHFRVKTAKLIDPINEKEYDNIGMRLDSSQSASYAVIPFHQHFWKADYTMHIRPNYNFNVRIASLRTNRSEEGNNENRYGRYLSDGATNIQVDGPEYFNIMPIWEWDKIPGTTSIDNKEDVLMDKSWGHPAANTFAGGVSDGKYGTTAYQLNYDGVSAKKAWFFFDDEIVCLGTDIHSERAESVTTTLNQSWLKGNVTTSTSKKKIDGGSAEQIPFTANQWLFHDAVAYLFPENTELNISTETQRGSWYPINHSFGKEEVSGQVFKTWIDHGKKPKNAKYAYIVLPGLRNSAAAGQYNNPIIILQNDKDAQAVFHKGLKLAQLVFHHAGTVKVGQLSITVDKSVVMMVKTLKGTEYEISVADPLQKEKQITITVDDRQTARQQQLTIDMPEGPMKGSTAIKKINL